jgi:hypothetical protein
MWVQAAPAFTDAAAIQEFKSAAATDGSQHAQWSTPVEVDATVLCPVYRFWSPVSSHHFYTLDEAERDKILTHYSHAWIYEGVAFHAYADGTGPQVVPVYRFWSDVSVGHFYTTDQAERDKLINNYPGVWTYEGVAFYTHAAASYPIGSHAVYRFWSPVASGHFYTMDEQERDKLLDDYPHLWTYEGIGWYVSDP